MPDTESVPPPVYVQGSLTELGEPLRETTFVVVDLETTGGAVDGAGITEIGAVKVRGGESLGEFHTLVNPGTSVPSFIAVLTGITDAMLVEAPRIETALPSFLEFARGAVLVAHNAAYDTGFLKAACAAHGYRWPGYRVIDTVTLARRVLLRDEVPNCKLATLARYFHTSHQPCHRALDDARATTDVLHVLLERVGNQRVHTLPELVEFSKALSPQQRRKRYLAEGVPAVAGVYVFRDASDRPLYVGTSGNLATRVRSYFTASETRKRISEMLAAAQRVQTVECAHSLEAEVRELRLIAAHKPPYNRRSKFPERVSWLKLTVEPYPRLSLVREVRDDGADYLGPFSSRRGAELAMAAVYDAIPLRQCTQRLSPRRTAPTCVLAELGRCPAPCEHRISVADYAVHAEAFRQAAAGDPGVLLDRLLARIGELAARQRYEQAATVRGRLVAFLRTAVRMQRLSGLTSIAELVAARPAPAPNGGGPPPVRSARYGWELSVVRHGRLVAAGRSPAGAHPQPTLDALLATAETVVPGPGPTPCASAEETERIAAWLRQPETRLVRTDSGWACRLAGAERWRELLSRAESAAGASDPFGEGRPLRAGNGHRGRGTPPQPPHRPA